MGLKYSASHIVNRRAVIQLADLFIEHRQNRFSIILKGPKNLGMGNNHWLQLNVTSHINLQESGLSFEALKPGTDFSFVPMKVLDGIFQYKAV